LRLRISLTVGGTTRNASISRPRPIRQPVIAEFAIRRFGSRLLTTAIGFAACLCFIAFFAHTAHTARIKYLRALAL
jgi:hypothetical protein